MANVVNNLPKYILFQVESGWKSEVDLLKHLEGKVGVVKGKGTKSRPLFEVVEVRQEILS